MFGIVKIQMIYKGVLVLECKHNIDYIFRYLDGDGDSAFNESFIKHIAECKKCKEEYEAEKMIRDACKFSDENEIDLPDGFHASFMSKLKLEISQTENLETAESRSEDAADSVRVSGSDIVPDIQSEKRKPFYRRFSFVSQLAAILVISIVVGTFASVIIRQISGRNVSDNVNILADNEHAEQQSTTERAAPAPFSAGDPEQDAVNGNLSDDGIPSVGEAEIEFGLSRVQGNNPDETNEILNLAAAPVPTVQSALQATAEVQAAANETGTIDSSVGTQKTTKAITSNTNRAVQSELASPNAVMSSDVALYGEENEVNEASMREEEDKTGLEIIPSVSDQMSAVEFFSEEGSQAESLDEIQDVKTGKTDKQEDANTTSISPIAKPTSTDGTAITDQAMDGNDSAGNGKISNMEYASFTDQESNLGYYENTLKDITKEHSGEIVKTVSSEDHSTWDITVQRNDVDELISDISTELSNHSVSLNYPVENHQSAAVTDTGIMPAANTAESQEHPDTATLRLTFEYRGNDGEQ